MEIKVLGSGCKNCKLLYENVKTAVSHLNLNATIDYITDMEAIANSGLMRTPGLIINQQIVSSGKVLGVDMIEALIKNPLEIYLRTL